jgi:hypothetical protein
MPTGYVSAIAFEREIGRGRERELDGYVERMVVDHAGNLLLAVSAVAGTTLAGTTLEGHKGMVLVGVAKLSPSGQPLWTRSFGASEGAAPSALVADNKGGLYVSGWTRGRVTGLAKQAIAGRGDRDAFITKLADDGRVMWSRVLGGPLTDSIESLAVDASGNLAVAGTFFKEADLGAGSLRAAGTPTLFVALYGADGAVRWTKTFDVRRAKDGNSASGWPQATLAVDGAGSLLVAGRFNGTLELGGSKLESSGSLTAPSCRSARQLLPGPKSLRKPAEAAFLLKLDDKGEVLWSRGFGASDRETGATGLSASRAGVLFSGRFSGELALGQHTLRAAANQDEDCECNPACRSRQQGLFVSQLDETGQAVAAFSLNGTSVRALPGPDQLPLVVSRHIVPSDAGKEQHQVEVRLQLFDWIGGALWQDSLRIAYDTRSGGAVAVDAQGNPLVSWTDPATHRIWLRKYALSPDASGKARGWRDAMK